MAHKAVASLREQFGEVGVGSHDDAGVRCGSVQDVGVGRGEQIEVDDVDDLVSGVDQRRHDPG
jgi:hypothetical protein